MWDTEIRTNLDDIRTRVDAAAAASPYGQSVQVLLATKTQPAEKIRVALEHGFTLIGENRVQELVAKFDELADIAHESHLIGPLQKNKVNHTLGRASCIQSIDDPGLAEKIQRRLDVLDSTVEYFVQVNTSREDSKSGVAPEAAAELVRALAPLDRMRLRGRMTIGLPGEPAAQNRPCYAALRTLRDQLHADGLLDDTALELSMGMSGDFELAISEGATMVRVGSSVFGARPKPTV